MRYFSFPRVRIAEAIGQKALPRLPSPKQVRLRFFDITCKMVQSIFARRNGDNFSIHKHQGLFKMLGYGYAGLFDKKLRRNIAIVCGRTNMAETTF